MKFRPYAEASYDLRQIWFGKQTRVSASIDQTGKTIITASLIRINIQCWYSVIFSSTRLTTEIVFSLKEQELNVLEELEARLFHELTISNTKWAEMDKQSMTLRLAWT